MFWKIRVYMQSLKVQSLIVSNIQRRMHSAPLLMEKAQVNKRQTSGSILPVLLLSLLLLWGCEKKPKTVLHYDVLEAEINGVHYKFKDLSDAGSISQYFTIQGEHKSKNGVYTFITISACNLSDWPNSKFFPLVKEYCPFFQTDSYAQIYISERGSFTSTIFITQDSIPNPHSFIYFEKFEVLDGNNYEIKGTFNMALAGEVGANPPSAPDSCFVNGRFHLKRPRRSTVD